MLLIDFLIFESIQKYGYSNSQYISDYSENDDSWSFADII